MPAAPHAPPFAPIAPESAGMPLYRVVKASLLRSIESGQHPPGSALPSETELALAFGVSIGTLRKAVDELAAEHIVARRQGRGTFVATHTADRFLLQFFPIERIDGRRSYEDISEEVSEELQAGLGPEDVAYLVAEKLAPLGVAAGPEGTPGEIQSADPLLALRFKKAVVPKGLVRAVTSVFFPLFFLPILVGAVVGLAILDFWMFGSHGIAQSLRATIFDPSLLLALFGVVVVTAAFHECGHATGCRYGGAEPGVMGVGLYLVWPAFYTDLTDTYRLGKWGRLRADLGGVYFNTLFVLATAGLYFLTHFEPLLIVILLLQLEILVQFMPFLRMDGYYMVADVTGVPDLFARIGAIFKKLFGRNQDA